MHSCHELVEITWRHLLALSWFNPLTSLTVKEQYFQVDGVPYWSNDKNSRRFVVAWP